MEREREDGATARDRRGAAAQALHGRRRPRHLGACERVGHAERRGGGRVPVGERRVVAAVRRGVVQRSGRCCERRREGRGHASGRGGPLARGPTRPRVFRNVRASAAAQPPGSLSAGSAPRRGRARTSLPEQRRDPAQRGGGRAHVELAREHERRLARERRARGQHRIGRRRLREALAGREPERALPGRAGERPAVDLRARRGRRVVVAGARLGLRGLARSRAAPRPRRAARAAGDRRAAPRSQRRAARRARSRRRSRRHARARRRRSGRARAAGASAGAPPAGRRRPEPGRAPSRARAPRRCRRRSKSVARGPPSSTSARSRSAWRAA